MTIVTNVDVALCLHPPPEMVTATAVAWHHVGSTVSLGHHAKHLVFSTAL